MKDQNRFPLHPKVKRQLSTEPNFGLHRNDLYTIHNIEKCVVFVWTYPGEQFWYYIHHQTKDMLIGFIKENEYWVYKPLYKYSIYTYY